LDGTFSATLLRTALTKSLHLSPESRPAKEANVIYAFLPPLPSRRPLNIFPKDGELKTNWKISNSSRSRRKQAAHAFPKLPILDGNFPIAARKSLSFVPGMMGALGKNIESNKDVT